MSKTEGALNKSASGDADKPARRVAGKYFRVLFWVVIFSAVILFIARNIGVFGNVLKVIMGFGAVVIIHEFGHFVVAKLCGIKVEAFSIFMPPTLFGVQRTKEGLKFRFLPGLSAKEGAASGGDQLSPTDGTEYRIGLIPFGGFIKMLGQEDIGAVKTSDDPRSFANKPVGVRMGVITAGVVFNAISAIIVFMIVFLIGISLPPAVVGEVLPNSPAAEAGLKPGDEIIEIAGKMKDLDISNISMAAALSDVNEPVQLKVRHENGSTEDYAIVAKHLRGMTLKDFGILPPGSLTIAKVSDPNKLSSKTGLLPGDKVVAVNGKEVQNFWELQEIVENSLAPEATLLAERADQTGKSKQVESRIGLELVSYGTGHIYSMVPRLRMENIEVKKPSWMKLADKGRQLLEKTGIIEKVQPKPFLQSGDIILSIGDVICPTSEEFREVVKQYGGKELPVNVLRTDANGTEFDLTISVRPKQHRDINEVAIGISYLPMLDIQHAVVAKTTDTKSMPKLDIPRGVTITAVDGVSVSNFYDVIREMRRYPGQRITLDWRLDANVAGGVALNADNNKDSITVKSAFGEFVPFEDLKRVYKATGPVNAVAMGYRKTVMFIAQTYLTLKRIIAGLVSPKDLMGPIGIIALSYRVVTSQPLIYYAYLLGLISAVIAVFNFLPLPPLDGGLIVILLIEKIKGSALSERTQGVIAYTGWVLIGGFFLYVTFNDIVRVIFG